MSCQITGEKEERKDLLVAGDEHVDLVCKDDGHGLLPFGSFAIKHILQATQSDCRAQVLARQCLHPSVDYNSTKSIHSRHFEPRTLKCRSLYETLVLSNRVVSALFHQPDIKKYNRPRFPK